MSSFEERVKDWVADNPSQVEVIRVFVIFILAVILAFLMAKLITSIAFSNGDEFRELQTECLQYETIGDMPAKCLDLFD